MCPKRVLWSNKQHTSAVVNGQASEKERKIKSKKYYEKSFETAKLHTCLTIVRSHSRTSWRRHVVKCIKCNLNAYNMCAIPYTHSYMTLAFASLNVWLKLQYLFGVYETIREAVRSMYLPLLLHTHVRCHFPYPPPRPRRSARFRRQTHTKIKCQICASTDRMFPFRSHGVAMLTLCWLNAFRHIDRKRVYW